MREADVHIGDSEFESVGLGEFVSLCRDAGVKDFIELACHGSGGVELVVVETRLNEQRLGTLNYVSRWERITESEDGITYLVAFKVPDLSDKLAAYAEGLKEGGHNVADNAVCEDGLMIDLSEMDNVRVNTETRTVQVGSGATLGTTVQPMPTT